MSDTKQSLELKITGLRTNPSPLDTKGGSLSVADNININAPNTAECRRGYKKYSDLFSLPSGKITALFYFKERLHAYYENKLAYDDGTGTFTDYAGTFVVPDANIGFKQSTQEGALYFPTTAGVKRLDALGGLIVDAGVPRGLNADYTLVSAGGDTIDDESALMYRIVWGYKDVNGKVLLGFPSERIVVVNTGAATSYDVKLKIYIPDGVTTSYFYQIYRTINTGSASIVPNEEAGLIYENNPTSADITAGFAEVTDQVPDALIGATIYTAPTQETILQSNSQPPLCKDLALFKNYMLYANCKTRHLLQLTIISVGGSTTTSLQAGDVITVNNENYLAVAIGAVHASGEFNIVTTGTVAENIEAAARELIKAINLKTSNKTVYAYYSSGFNELPGKLMIERRDLSDTVFYAYITTSNSAEAHGNSFNPTLPEGSSISVKSSNETKTNRVYIGKLSEPDGVPLLNYLDFGTDQSEIVRILSLRDTCFILKDDGTVYKLNGEDLTSFVVNKFDDTVTIYGANTAVVFNNQVFCMSTQGIIAISESGVEVKSWDIEDEIIKYLSKSQYPNFQKNAFGVNYESERKYILFDGELRAWVYNSFTNTWTNWTRAETAGIVNNLDDKLYLSKSDGYIRQERKDFNIFDYADDEFNVTITGAGSVATDTVVLTDITNVEVGQSLKQGDYRYAKILAVDSGGIVTLDEEHLWEDGAATVNKAIKCDLKWLPLYGDTPGQMKRFIELLVYFRDMNKDFDILFQNNFDTSTGESITLQPTYEGNTYGEDTYGEGIYGGEESGSQEHRVYFPLKYQRALWALITFSTERAFTRFSMNAAALITDTYSQRFMKK